MAFKESPTHLCFQHSFPKEKKSGDKKKKKNNVKVFDVQSQFTAKGFRTFLKFVSYLLFHETDACRKPSPQTLCLKQFN